MHQFNEKADWRETTPFIIGQRGGDLKCYFPYVVTSSDGSPQCSHHPCAWELSRKKLDNFEHLSIFRTISDPKIRYCGAVNRSCDQLQEPLRFLQRPSTRHNIHTMAGFLEPKRTLPGLCESSSFRVRQLWRNITSLCQGCSYPLQPKWTHSRSERCSALQILQGVLPFGLVYSAKFWKKLLPSANHQLHQSTITFHRLIQVPSPASFLC